MSLFAVIETTSEEKEDSQEVYDGDLDDGFFWEQSAPGGVGDEFFGRAQVKVGVS